MMDGVIDCMIACYFVLFDVKTFNLRPVSTGRYILIFARTLYLLLVACYLLLVAC